jgi:methionyl-tRNA formyltransferase
MRFSVPQPAAGGRVVLAGNNEAACLVLDLLLERLAPTDVLVISPPGGVHHAWQPSLERHARGLGVRALAPADVNDPEVVAEVAAHGASLLLSVYYTQIFRADLLRAVDGPALNFHPSLLPRHRGVAPLVWAIVEGDGMAGVTAHHIDAEVDTGDVVLQRPLPIHPEDTGHSLHRKAARLVHALAAELLRPWLDGTPIPAGTPQSGAVSHHTGRDPQLNHLDFSAPAERIRNIVRALAPPLPGAWCGLGGERIVLERVTAAPAADLPRPPGMVQRLRDDAWTIWAADGPLRVDTFWHDGRRRPAADLLAFATEGEIAA